MARKKAQRNHYAELAAYLNPDSPLDGARRVDRAILQGLRLRANRRNLALCSERAGMACAVVSVFLMGVHYEVAAIGVKDFPISGISWQYGVLGTLAGIILVTLGFRHMFDEGPPYEAPRVIGDWLRDHGDGRSLQYWDEIYWSWPKRDAYRYQILGFTFWRKSPVDLSSKFRAAVLGGTA
jgi:hypothetical protein